MKIGHQSGPVEFPAPRRVRRDRTRHAFRPADVELIESRLVLTALTPADYGIFGPVTYQVQPTPAFTYGTVTDPPTGGTGTVGAGSTISFAASNSPGPLQGTQGIALAKVTDQSTATNPTDMGTVPFTISLNIAQVAGPAFSPGPDLGSLTVTGSLTFTRSDTGGQLSTLSIGTISGPVTIGNSVYTLSNITYAQPTVQAPGISRGTISGVVTVTPAPSNPLTSLALSPGYWKTHTAAANQALALALGVPNGSVDMSTETVGQVFTGIDPALSGKSLQDILDNPGGSLHGVAGQENVLLFQAIAGLLNAGAATLPNSGITYPVSPKMVIQSVNNAVQFLTLFGDPTLLNTLQSDLDSLNGGQGEGTLNSSLFDTSNSKKK